MSGGRRGLRKRWLVVLLPAVAVAALVAIAPSSPPADPVAVTATRNSTDIQAGPFRYSPDQEAYSLDFDPRWVRISLLEGWDREQDAYGDRGALAFISGPMYERQGAEGVAATVPLGDLKFGERIWRGPNRSAARQRAFIGIRHDGRVDFGYGELSADRADRYDTFIGGLHSVYNDLESPPASYKGAYSISMGQQIRYYLPRIRVLFGLRPDGRLAVLMSRDGLTLEQTKDLARSRGFLAAYMPDHASKSRFIIPGVKGFSADDANWISGGATSFVHVPYMLRLSERSSPLQGSLLAGLTPLVPRMRGGCGNPLECGGALVAGIADRAMAGFNRLMEHGVEPLARLIWAPQIRPVAGRSDQQAPLREPVITADPQAIQERQQRDLAARQLPVAVPLPPPPQLPDPQPAAPPTLDAGTVAPGASDGGQPGMEAPRPSLSTGIGDPVGEGREPSLETRPAVSVPPRREPPLTTTTAASATTSGASPAVTPPPPALPPPPLP